MALIVGLTGGIGSGKSVAANYLSQLGVPTIDADDVARTLCESKQPAFLKIRERFGDNILNSQGELDRKKLRKIIFENVTEKLWLENFLHPLIIKYILDWAKKTHSPYNIVVAPLLLETSMKDYVDRILVIDCSKKKQIERASKRDFLNKKEIELILKQQLSRKERLSMADDVIVNNDSLEELEKSILVLHDFYRSL